MKRIIIVLILVFVISLGLGFVYSRKVNNKDNESTDEIINLMSSANTIKKNENFIRTNTSNEKISPNATLILKKQYKECGHTIKDYVKIPEDLVNLSKEELKHKYETWDLIGFSSKEIVLSKEYPGICSQHYVLREEKGNVVIYKLDDEKIETLYKNTNISTEYLTLEDKEKLKTGIFVYSKEELNSAIEDFE